MGGPAKTHLKDLPEFSGLLHHALECLQRAAQRWPKTAGTSRTGVAVPLARLKDINRRLEALSQQASDEVRFSLAPEDMLAAGEKPAEVLDVGVRYIEKSRASLRALFAARTKGFQIGKGPSDNVADDVLKAYADLGVIEDDLTAIQDALDPPGRRK